MIDLHRLYLRAICIVLLACTSVAGYCHERARTDSLRSLLPSAATSHDSLTILFNIYDLSPETGKRAMAEEVARAAGRTTDTIARLEMIIRRSTFAENDSAKLHSLAKELSAFGDTERTREISLYIDVLLIRLRAQYDYELDSRLPELIQIYNTRRDLDNYDQVRLLFSICTYMSRRTHGDLLEHYMSRLDDALFRLPLHTGAIRYYIYSLASPIYCANGNPDLALRADKKILNIVDSLSTVYAQRGRPYNTFVAHRYDSYRRMMANYENISYSQAVQYYNNVEDLCAEYPQIKAEAESNPIIKAFYYMATKQYGEALPLLKKAIATGKNSDFERQLYRAQWEAAHDAGTTAEKLKAGDDFIRVMLAENAATKAERLRELKILDDAAKLTKLNESEKDRKVSKKYHFTAIMLAVAVIVIIGLIVMILLNRRRIGRLRHHIARQRKTAEEFRAERARMIAAERELAMQKERADTAEKVKADFINNMSHEIKTPLASIAEYTRLITDCIPEDKRPYLEPFADTIEMNTKLVLTLVNDVLDIAAIEHRTLELNPVPTSVYRLCNLAMDNVFEKGVSTNGKVTVLFNPSDKPDRNITTDPQRCAQVLINLLSNAKKFTESGSITLDFDISEKEREITFSVTDTGMGIAQAQRERIFEKFYQVDTSAQGCGLGLYISRLIADMLKGSVTLDESYCRGARFRFKIGL